MNKIFAILTLGLQIALTFIVTCSIYMVFALLDNDFGFEGLFGLFIIQPILAIIISVLTIILCLIIGLPIRLNTKLNYWWTTNFYVSIIGTVCGLTLLIIALFPDFKETVSTSIDGQTVLKQIPNSSLSYIGWLLTAFSTLHIYPPRQLVEKVNTIFYKTFKISLAVLASLTMINCGNSNSPVIKQTLLKADREAPLGWVYLTIYQDSTFEFISTGIRSNKNIYKGKVEIHSDSLFFAYTDSIPNAGKTAVYNNKIVSYIDGKYSERLNINSTKLTNENKSGI